MSNRLGGKQGTAYLGTNANQPPNWHFHPRDPDQYDINNVSVGDMWLNTVSRIPWVLVSLQGDANSKGALADWITFAGGMGTVTEFTTDDSVIVIPVAGNVNIFGAHGINTTGAGDTVTIAINNAITLGDLTPLGVGVGAVTATTGDIIISAGNLQLPATNTAGTQGVITLGGQRFAYANASGENAFLGVGAGNSGTTPLGPRNTGVGFLALSNLTTGFDNTAIGTDSLGSLTTGTENTACGAQVSGSLLTGSDNTLIGFQAGASYTGAESSNIIIGALNGAVLGESNTMRIGAVTSAGPGGITKTYIAACYSNYGNSNTFVGVNAGNFSLTVGVANQNVAVGTGALPAITTATANTALGVNAMAVLTTSPSNVAVGAGALFSLVSGLGGNSAVGVSALDAVTTGDTNSALGFVAGARITTGGGNICVGSASGSFLTTGDDNVFIGEAVGTNGVSAGLTTGSSNVLIGTNSASVYTTNESNNLIILNDGVIGDSNFIRIGSNGGGIAAHTKCFIAGIRGRTTDAADAIAVLISSTGQLGTVSSSSRYKEDIEDLGEESEDIYRLKPRSFRFKKHETAARSFGLIAEEVDQVIPSLVVYDDEGLPDAIKYHDLPVLLLNELQKLHKRVKELEAQINKL